MEKDVIPNIKGKPALRLFFDMLSLFLKDALALKRGDSIYLSAYATILSALSQKLPKLEENIVDVMTMRAEIESNINPGLLLTHLVYVLSKEWYTNGRTKRKLLCRGAFPRQRLSLLLFDEKQRAENRGYRHRGLRRIP